MTLEDAKKCLKKKDCNECKYNDSNESCLEKAVEIAITAIEYLQIGQKLSAEAEKDGKQ